jgi:peroxiredoxin
VSNRPRLLSLAVPILCLCAASLLAAPAAAPNLKSVDGPGLVKAIRAHKGKVVVLNLWATWCPPCVEEFPEFVKLHNTHRKQGLAVIGASLDEPEDRRKVADFMVREKVPFEIYMRTTRTLEEFIDPVDKKWTGIAPTTYVFGRNGKMAGPQAAGKMTYEQLVAKVKPLLGAAK